MIANSVLDTVMTSRYSATDLAALALGGSIYISVFLGLNGVLQALSPIIGQLYGAHDFDAIGKEAKQGIWLALFLSCIGCAVLIFPQALLSLAHASPELTAKATLYLRTLAFALPATLAFTIYGALNNAIGRPKMVMVLQVMALLLKIPLNAWFIFGGFSLPAFGGPGSAIATALIAWLMLLLAWGIMRTVPFYRNLKLFGSGFVAPQWPAQRALLRLGIPMGLSYFIEVTSFAFMALFIARLGDTVVAGHQIVANFGAVLYMVPLSIAIATGVLVAQAIGAHDQPAARKVGSAGIRLAMAVSGTLGILIWLGRDLIVRAYTPDPAVIASALPLFLYIGFYQLFDALQTTAAFILRAYRVAIIPTVMNSIALWGVGLGGGYVLGLDPFQLAPAAVRGAAGFWLSNSLSLVLLAAGLLWYLRWVQRSAQVRQ